MKRGKWEKLILIAAQEAQEGNRGVIDLLSQHLEEVDQAKEALLNKGYSPLTGASLLQTIQNRVPPVGG